LTIRGTLETKRAGVNCAATLLATDVPRTRDGGAVLALSQGRTSTARLELDRGVNAFVVFGGRPRDGARVKTRGAEGGRTLVPGVTLPIGASA